MLTPPEADHLFRILRGLRDGEGKTIVLITHKLREIMDATDTVSVMRRGEMTATVRYRGDLPRGAGRADGRPQGLLRVDKAPARPGAVVLAVRGLRVRDGSGVERLRGIDLDVRAGEILGVAGGGGNGQSELLQVLGGITAAEGTVTLDGEPLDLAGADGRARRRSGIAHVPEDRHRLGLILDFAAWENTAFGYHDRPEYARGPMLDGDALRRDTRGKIERFDIRPADCFQRAANFSGGNQQKIVLAREIERDPRLLLVGQPTRGVDIGAIEFIHQRLVELRDAGRAILLVSVELDEIMGLADRIAVMFDGRIMGERLPSETSEAELGLLMAGMDGTALGNEAPGRRLAPGGDAPAGTGAVARGR